MAKCKFMVGDMVKPTEDNPYTLTGQGMEAGIVTYVGKCGFFDGDMKVKVLKHRLKDFEGIEAHVKSNFFEKFDETIVIYRNKNKVIALDKSTGKKAEARCNPADDFDFHVGARIAFERLDGTEKKSVVKEVKRPAKVGECIKIVDAHPTPRRTFYKNGDVLIVMKTKMIGNEEVVSLSNELGDYIYQSEYVVLENHNPSKEEFFTDEMSRGLKCLCECIRILKEEGLSTREANEIIKDIILRK